jgi:hypothetical protein
MKRALLLLVVTLSFSSLALAQQRTEVQIGPGGQVTGVKQVQVPVPEAFLSFEEADANHNGCVDKREAYNAGILANTFNKFARRGCLNKAQYEAAATAPNY